MKINYRIFFLLVTCFLSSHIAFSQDVVTITIDQIKVNNTSIQIGSPIDLGSNPTKNVGFRIKLSKPSALEVGPCTMYVRTYNSSGTFRELFKQSSSHLHL